MSVRQAFAAFVAVFVLAATFGATVATASFQQPEALTRVGYDENQPAIAFDAAGNALAAWGEYPNHIRAAYRPAGGSFGDPRDIGTYPMYGQVGGPFVGFDTAGNAQIGWGVSAGDVDVVTRSAAGVYAPQQKIGGPLHASFDFDFAVAPTGAAAAVYLPQSGSGTKVVVRPAGGSFGAVETADPGGFDTPRVALGTDGTVAVAWDDYGSGPVFDVKPPGQGWRSGFRPSNGTPPTHSAWPNLAVDSTGGVLGVWLDSNGDRISSIYRPAGATTEFGATDQLADEPGEAAGSYFFRGPELGFDAADAATIVWKQYVSSSEMRVWSALRPANGTFGTPVAVSPAGEQDDFARLSVAPDGTALAAWLTPSPQTGGGGPPTGRGPLYATARIGGVWSSPVVLSPSAWQPSLAARSDSLGLAIWGRAPESGCAQLETSLWTSATASTLTPPACKPGEVDTTPPDNPPADQPVAATQKPPADTVPADTVPPKLEVPHGLRRHVAKAKAVRLSLGCDESCSGSATAKLELHGRKHPHAASTPVALAPVSFAARPGQSAKVRLALAKKTLRKLRRVLSRHGRASLAVVVAATDGSGNRSTATTTVRLVP